jgi:peroxiredoxin
MSRLFDVGNLVPDATLPDHEGHEITFSTLWKQQPTIFYFMRHFGCPHCRSQAIALRQQREKLSAAGLTALIIGLGSPDAAADFREEYDLPFTILCDPTKRIYARYGLLRMRPFREMDPHNLRQTIKRGQEHGGNMFSGNPFKERQDIFQLGGIFVVNQAGRADFVQRSRRMSDFPELDDILAALARRETYNSEEMRRVDD